MDADMVGSVYDQLISELLIDPEQISEEVRSAIMAETSDRPTAVIVVPYSPPPLVKRSAC